MSTSRQKFKEPILEKLMRRITKTESCWLWMPKAGRYGTFYNEGKSTPAHRAVYEAVVGKVPKGLVLDHLCGQRYCVNPEHLEAVTQAVNSRRYFSSLTHCKHGHEFTLSNTHLDKRGHRVCRACHRKHQLEYSSRKLVKGGVSFQPQ